MTKRLKTILKLGTLHTGLLGINGTKGFHSGPWGDIGFRIYSF